MRRRRFLALLGGTAAAGCSAPETGVGTAPPTLTPVEVPATRTQTPGSGDPIQSRGQFGEASVVNLRTGPRTLALSPVRYERDDLRVDLQFTASATVTRPARLGLALTNTGESTRQVDFGSIPPLDRGLILHRPAAASTHDAPVRRLLVPVGGALGDSQPAIDRGPAGYWHLTGTPSTLPDALDVDAGATRTGSVLLLGPPGARGFPKGRYRATSGPLSLAVWDTGAPGPRENSPFDGQTVPDLPNTDGTDWFHEATSRTGIFLRPAVERGDAPTTFRFTLVNHSLDPLGGNPAEWKLYKLVDGDWFRIAPWTVDLAAGPLPPGGRFEYVVAAGHGAPPDCACSATGGAVGHLGGGLYALESGFARVRTSETYAALFRLDAPGLRVDPSAAATVDRQGDRTVVTRPEWGDGTAPADAVMTVTPAPDSQGDRVVPEQVFRAPFLALRDVVPHLSATPVVLRSDARVVGAFVGLHGEEGHRTFTFDGETYVATAGDTPG
jgi:hypothetical protein